MNIDFQNIDEYIAIQDINLQEKLHELRAFILKFSPEETTETISYKMPTFRYHGNLIHFAQYKNHIGIYPGSHAIEALAELTAQHKTSKGAIQIPNDTPLDKNLIQQIIKFNVSYLKNKKESTWTGYPEKWIDLYEKMGALIQKTHLKKELKWGMEIYTHQGKNVIGWSGFKNFFALWFYYGVFLQDKDKVLVAATEGKTQYLRQWRLTDVSQFKKKKILAYIQESIQMIEEGKSVTLKKSPPKAPEGMLKDELDNNKELNRAFEKLTSGRQKDYIEYIEEAKMEKTKQSRLDKIIPLILAGKGLHDKYKR